MAIDKSFLPMISNKDPKTKKNFCCQYGWLITILILILIATIILTTVFVTQARRNSPPSMMTPLDISTTAEKHNITIKDLLTFDTAAKANVCRDDESIENCVLIYNAKVIMNALVLVPTSTSEQASVSLIVPTDATKRTVDCKGLYIRRNQLPQILSPSTLQTVYTLSGIPFTSDDNSTSSLSSDQTQERSQIDARSIQYRWTSPINYYISTTSGFTAPMIANIRTAVANWNNNTCLKFNELSVVTSTTNKSYILFQRDDDYGCSSPVSYDPTDPTSVILISAYCSNIIPSMMHEIGHTLGFVHTQSRIDRDSYVTIVTANIQQEYAANFFKWAYGTIRFLDMNIPYDFGSFMHYEPYGFSKNGEATILPLDSRFERTYGQREKAAFYDYKQINRLYWNRAECPQMFTNSCQNNGYLDPKTCSYCVCPDGFSGTYCDQRDSKSMCGDIITNPNPYSATRITIQNPSPTSTISTEQYCVYFIRSLSPGKIRFQLDGISTVSRYVCSLTSYLEVKYQSDLAVTGARWCGTTVPTPWLNITAETNTVVVIFRANNSINPTTRAATAGFRATIIFDPEPTPGANLSATAATVATTTTTTTTTVSTTRSTVTTTTKLTTTVTTISTCPPSSYRCQLSSQPTCGGCLSYQPCTSQGSQQCTAYNYQVQLTDCDKIVDSVAQCRYQFTLTPYITNCPHTVLLCCPNYQLVSNQGQYFCIYNPQATNPTDWSLIT